MLTHRFLKFVFIMSSLTLIICGTSISSANAIAGARQTGMTISSQIPIDAKGTYALGIALDQFGHFYIVGAENGVQGLARINSQSEVMVMPVRVQSR